MSHIWQLWSSDDCLPTFCVLWPAAILFGCHGNITFWKRISLNDNVKTTEAVWLWFGTNVAWVRASQNSQNYGDLLFGLVAMATESAHTYNGKRVKLYYLHSQGIDANHIWHIWSSDDCLLSVCVWWPVAILFGCHGNIKFQKKEFFKWQLLQNHWSSMTLIWFKCCLGKDNSK